MLEYFQNQRALLHVRLLKANGDPAPGVTSGQVTVTLEKPDGTIVAVSIDGVNNVWTEVSSGAFLNQGKYDLILAGSLFDQLGGFVVAITGGTGSTLLLAKTVVNVITAVWEEPSAGHNTPGTMGESVTALVNHDFTPPVATIISPTPGTTISPTTPIQFQVTDAAGLQQVIVAVSYPGPNDTSTRSPTEVVYDGTSFRVPFKQYSTVSAISQGLLFNVRRDSNWPATPEIEVYAVDIHGNEGV